MQLKLSRPLVCFDLETTGLDTQNDRVVELGMVKLMPDGERLSWQRRFDPGIDIPEAATKIHGIHNDDVRGLFGEPRLGNLSGEILEFIATADLAGFNAIRYDLPLWLCECARYKLAFSMEDRCVVDAKVIFDRKEVGWDRFLQGPRNLNNAVLHYCGRDQAAEFAKRDAAPDEGPLRVSVDDRNRHSAVKDAEATLDVLAAQLRRYPDLGSTVRELHEFCHQSSDRSAATR